MAFNIGKLFTKTTLLGGLGASLFGRKKKGEPTLPAPPEYFEDPNYRKSQDFLQTYGIDILNGKIPDYYKPIGERNSQEFQDMLRLSNSQIQRGAEETAALTGRGRGGSLPSVTAQQIGDNTVKLSFADYLNSIEGKKFLFNQGRGITEGVRQSGQQESFNRNKFNIDSYNFTRENALWDIARADQAAALEGKMIGKLAGPALSLAGGAIGFMAGGPMGAAAGAQIGQGVGNFIGGNGNLDIASLFGGGKTTTARTNTDAATGISSIGRINSSDLDLDALFAGIKRKAERKYL